VLIRPVGPMAFNLCPWTAEKARANDCIMADQSLMRLH
jgi:hypothetical protein